MTDTSKQELIEKAAKAVGIAKDSIWRTSPDPDGDAQYEQITFESATGEKSLLVAVGDLLHIGMDVPARVTSVEDSKWRFSDKRKLLLVCEVIDPEDGVRFESIHTMHPDFPERWPRHWTPTDEAILIERGYSHTVTAGELSGNPGQFEEWPHERICRCGATGVDTPCVAAEVRSTDTIRCDYCGDDLPSVKNRASIPTTPNLQRLGFSADKIVCPECVARARSTDTTRRDPRQRAEYLAASKADAALSDWRPTTNEMRETK